jgi:hypothetical protein
MKPLPKIINDEVLEAMWKEFDTPLMEDSDDIDEDFYIWPKGTSRFEVWHWFDDNHSKGLAVGIQGMEE